MNALAATGVAEAEVAIDGNTAAEAPRRERGERGERGEAGRRERGGRRGERRTEDGAAPAREVQSDAARGDSEMPLQATDAGQEPSAQDHGDAPQDAGEGQRGGRDRNRRDRYGRERRPRAEQAEAGETAVEATPTADNSAQADEADTGARRSYFSQPATAVAPAPAAAVHEGALAPAPVAPVQAPLFEPAAAPVAAVAPRAPVAAPAVAAPVPAPATGLPKVQAFALDIAPLQNLAQDSGLEWVHSDLNKVQQVQAAIAAEPKPIHVPREPKPVVAVDDGPLVLVETRRDLRNMVLPFEQTGNTH